MDARAGGLVVELEGHALRSVRLDGAELLRGVFPALRDTAWDAVPAQIDITRRDLAGDRFAVAFIARHRRDGLDTTWDGEVAGAPDGTIVYAIQGRFDAAFHY